MFEPRPSRPDSPLAQPFAASPIRHLHRCVAAVIILAAAMPRSTAAQARHTVAAIGDTVRILAATAPRLPAAQQPLTGVLAHVRPEAIVLRTRRDSAIVARPVVIQVQRWVAAMLPAHTP